MRLTVQAIARCVAQPYSHTAMHPCPCSHTAIESCIRTYTQKERERETFYKKAHFSCSRKLETVNSLKYRNRFISLPQRFRVENEKEIEQTEEEDKKRRNIVRRWVGQGKEDRKIY
jgi:hypothetical protein